MSAPVQSLWLLLRVLVDVACCRGPTMNSQSQVTMPQLMREAAPWQRNVIIVRDPVDRYASAFYYYG